jgi:putative glutamine amidotransferase
MSKRPLILVSAGIESKGSEFSDQSLSLSVAYERALLDAGMIPVVMPSAANQEIIAECVRRTDGVLLSGGEDVNPDLYAKRIPARLRRTVTLTPDDGVRDLREFLLVDEVFRQRKPLLAICRGQQVLNVALGGTLVMDISRQIPGALNHRRSDRRALKVHEVSLTPDALLAKITRKRTLGVNSTHHQAVDEPAGVLTVVARSADGVIEGLQLKAEAARLLPFLLSVQFHPERLAGRHPEHHAIFAAFAKACAPKRQP